MPTKTNTKTYDATNVQITVGGVPLANFDDDFGREDIEDVLGDNYGYAIVAARLVDEDEVAEVIASVARDCAGYAYRAASRDDQPTMHGWGGWPLDGDRTHLSSVLQDRFGLDEIPEGGVSKMGDAMRAELLRLAAADLDDE